MHDAPAGGGCARPPAAGLCPPTSHPHPATGQQGQRQARGRVVLLPGPQRQLRWRRTGEQGAGWRGRSLGQEGPRHPATSRVTRVPRRPSAAWRELLTDVPGFPVTGDSQPGALPPRYFAPSQIQLFVPNSSPSPPAVLSPAEGSDAKPGSLTPRPPLTKILPTAGGAAPTGVGCSSLGMNDLPTPELNPILKPSSHGGGGGLPTPASPGPSSVPGQAGGLPG